MTKMCQHVKGYICYVLTEIFLQPLIRVIAPDLLLFFLLCWQISQIEHRGKTLNFTIFSAIKMHIIGEISPFLVLFRNCIKYPCRQNRMPAFTGKNYKFDHFLTNYVLYMRTNYGRTSLSCFC